MATMTKAARERVAKFRRLDAQRRRSTVDSLARWAPDDVSAAELNIISVNHQVTIRKAKREFGLHINRKTGV